MDEWLRFDMAKIRLLRTDYIDAMDYIKSGFPGVNFNSRREIINFFDKTFQIDLNSAKIKEIAHYLAAYKEDSVEHELITGIVYWFKMKYAIKNYLDCIIRHEVNGKVILRDFMGKLSLPNRQSLPYSMEIQGMILDGTPLALSLLPKQGDSQWQMKRSTLTQNLEQ